MGLASRMMINTVLMIIMIRTVESDDDDYDDDDGDDDGVDDDWC